MLTAKQLKARRERRRANIEKRVCEWCEKIYSPIRQHQKFCSPEHRVEYHREKYLAIKAGEMEDGDNSLQSM